MTHEPDHTRTGTSKTEKQPPREPFSEDGIIPDAGGTGGEFGVGGVGGHGDVAGGADGRGGEWFVEGSGDGVEEGATSHFGVDGDFGCTRPPGLGGIWSPTEPVGATRDSAGEDCSFDVVPGIGAERVHGRIGRRRSDEGFEQGAEEGDSTRSFAEVFREDWCQFNPKTEDLLDPGDVPGPDEETDGGT